MADQFEILADEHSLVNPGPDGEVSILRQWRAFKAQYPEGVLLFRLGTFWEAFYADATVVSLLLGKRMNHLAGRPDVPVTGIPAWELDEAVATLVKGGHRVALIEPIKEVSEKKKPTK